MSRYIVETADLIWEEFQHKAARGLAPGRRASLPETDPRFAPLPDDTEENQP